MVDAHPPPLSPLSRNPPMAFDVPAVPAIPPRLDRPQHDRSHPPSTAAPSLVSAATGHKPGIEQPVALKPVQIPSRVSSRQDPVPMAHPSENASDHKSSRTASLASSSDSNDTYGPSPTSTTPTPLSIKRLGKERTLDVLPEDYDLEVPMEDGDFVEDLERVSDVLFSARHLRTIFSDPSSLLKFTSFLMLYRPQSIPVLIYYLDATKALKAINYANAITRALEPLPEQELASISVKTSNTELEEKARRAFELLAERDLPSYTAYLYIHVVKSSMMKPVLQGPQSAESPEGFAEIFCLTDPSRPDNPIVLASEAFHQMTQYSMNYIIGRNCRFLQGPKTNPASLERIRATVANREEHCEIILNYRRDGSPFMNLFMHAPLYDHFGKLRYFMGAQIDVSHVIENNPELESLQRVLKSENEKETEGADSEKDVFQQLIETFDMEELSSVRAWEDRILQQSSDEAPRTKKSNRPGLLRNHHSEILKNGLATTEEQKALRVGMYSHYMLVRPYPSLRILFTSPSLSLPGMVQAPIMDKLGGSGRVRYELTQALEEGREVTAKIRWKTSPGDEGQDRWIFFTPLVGKKGEIGVWMAILEDDIPESMERVQQIKLNKSKFRTTSPILEESETEDQEPLPRRRSTKHKHSRTLSAAKIIEQSGQQTLLTNSVQRSREPSISGTISTMNDEDGELMTLEERLRRKRERDMAMMVDGPGMNSRRTYKSFSPEGLLNLDD